MLGTVPVGLLYFATPVVAEDSVIRLVPIDETFVYSDAKNKSRERLDSENLIVGNYWNTYLKFDLTSLGNVKRADMRSAKLRLAVVDTGMISDGARDCSFNISYIDNDNWNDGMTWDNRPMGEEQYLCTASGADRDSILEIDLSEFIAGTAGFDDKIITLKLSPSLSNSAPIRLASAESTDPAYRPCLKITVGDARDNDPTDLRKSHLDDNGYISAARPYSNSRELTQVNNGMLAVDNGSAAYLKFGLNLGSILGTVNNAEIFVRPETKSPDIKVKVYYLENDNWNSSDITYNSRPEGEMIQVQSFNGIDSDGGLRIDVTDIVYEAVSGGKSIVSFIIDGTDTPAESTGSLSLRSSFFENGAPELRISCTDDRYVAAIREALANLKGANSSFDDITTDLPSEFIASNGERVAIKWGLNENFSFENLLTLNKRIITSSGHVNPPSIFEGAKEVEAKAQLSCGDETMNRFIIMTIKPDIGVPGRIQPLYDALWQN